MDLLEGLQGSKLSYSSRADSDSPLHALHLGSAQPGQSEGAPIAPHSAWQALLDSRLPFLLAENKAAAEFLLLYEPAADAPSQPGSPVKPAGQRCHTALLVCICRDLKPIHLVGVCTTELDNDVHLNQHRG